MRAFVRFREFLLTQEDLTRELAELEKKRGRHEATGEPFAEDSLNLETLTRVKDVSPPPGSLVPRDEPDVTLYLEYCNGGCIPKTTAWVDE